MKASTLGILVGVVSFIFVAPFMGCMAIGHFTQRGAHPLDLLGFAILAIMVPVAFGGSVYRKRKNREENE